MGILADIIDRKRAEVARQKARLPSQTLHQLLPDAPSLRDFYGVLARGPAPRIIAEVKRASPSRGVLRPDRAWQPEALAQAYEQGGAVALSVLTDVPWFWGHADHLVACRAATSLPVLRKDFLVDAYQIDESRWLGADAVLLLAGVLDNATLHHFAARALELGMAVIVEVHEEADLRAALAVAGERVIIGINHRDLRTFAIDPQRSINLAPHVPAGRPVVAESGVDSAAEIGRLMAAGLQNFLIGTHLAMAADPRGALLRLVGA